MRVLFSADHEPDDKAPLKNFGVEIRAEGPMLFFPLSIAQKLQLTRADDFEDLVRTLCDVSGSSSIADKLHWQIHEVRCAVYIFARQVMPWLSRDFFCKYPEQNGLFDALRSG